MTLISTPGLRSGLLGLGLKFIGSHVSLKHLIITATATMALAEEREERKRKRLGNHYSKGKLANTYVAETGKRTVYQLSSR